MRHATIRFTIAAFILILTSPVVGSAVSPTPVPTEPPGTPGEVDYVGNVGVSLRADSEPIPPGCAPHEVVGLIRSSLDAFNEGDHERLLRFFPSDDGAFHWYSVNGRPGGFNPGFTADDREDLVPYLAERHAHGERMRLLQIDYGTTITWEGGGRGIEFTLDVLRAADDIPTHQAGVKGTIDCLHQRISVWSMGDRGIVPDTWFDTPPATSVTLPTVGAEIACPVTTPNGAVAAGQGPIERGYGNDVLYTGLWTEGRVIFEPGGPGFVLPDGSLGMKWGWWPLVPGEVSIEGHRLDRAARPLRADIGEGFHPDGYGSEGRFFPTYVIFPTPGCWEVTGSIDGQSLTFVTEVVLVGEGPDWRPDEIP